jgi:hypothetical protein
MGAMYRNRTANVVIVLLSVLILAKRSRAQDRARVAGGQDYEVGYTAKKTRKSTKKVKKAVRRVGNSLRKVERALERGR